MALFDREFPRLPDLVIQPGSDLTIPWREFISKSGVTSDSQWKTDGSQAQMTIDVYWSDRAQAIQEILGYPYRNGGSLARQLPMRHPDWVWLYAINVTSLRGIDWRGKVADEGNNPLTQAGSYSEYGLARITINFGTLPYDVFADGETDEWDRFVIKTSKPASEMVSMDRGAYAFIDGPPGTKGATFKGQMNRRVSRSTVVWQWINVPTDLIFNADLSATNIEAGLGRINDDFFAGSMKGTMLLDSVEFVPVMASVDPRVLGMAPGQTPRMWNVMFYFKVIKPPYDPSSEFFDSYEQYGYGHNLAPDITHPEGYWYPIVSAPTATVLPNPPSITYGPPPYLQYSFPKLFEAIP